MMKRVKGLGVGLGSLILGLCGVASAQAQTPAPPVAAPQAWIVYATEVQGEVAALLASTDEAASSLRLRTLEAYPDPVAPPPPLAVNLWISPEGLISQARFQTSAVTQLDEALGRLLVGRRLAPPPPDMINPLRMRVRIEPDLRGVMSTTPAKSAPSKTQPVMAGPPVA